MVPGNIKFVHVCRQGSSALSIVDVVKGLVTSHLFEEHLNQVFICIFFSLKILSSAV